MMQLCKKCSTIKVHCLHRSTGRVAEDSGRSETREGDSARRCPAAQPHLTPH